jgi:excisionase family DNA binding protein
MHNGNGSAPLLTVVELAEQLKVSPSLIYRLCRERGLPRVRVGGVWRFELAAVLRALTVDDEPLDRK